jgi:hypothetical protein
MRDHVFAGGTATREHRWEYVSDVKVQHVDLSPREAWQIEDRLAERAIAGAKEAFEPTRHPGAVAFGNADDLGRNGDGQPHAHVVQLCVAATLQVADQRIGFTLDDCTVAGVDGFRGEEPSSRSTLAAMALTVLEDDRCKAFVAESRYQISPETGLTQMIIPEQRTRFRKRLNRATANHGLRWNAFSIITEIVDPAGRFAR